MGAVQEIEYGDEFRKSIVVKSREENRTATYAEGYHKQILLQKELQINN
jgi:hypothetical protein